MEVAKPKPVRRETVEVICAFCGTPSNIVITTHKGEDGKELETCEFTICCEAVATRANVDKITPPN